MTTATTAPPRCRSGRHELAGDNVLRTGEGRRRCRACRDERRALAYERQQAAARAAYRARHEGHDVLTRSNGWPYCRTCRTRAHDIDEIAIVRAVQGDPAPGLTLAEREAAVLHLRRRGLTYRAIGEHVGCSVWTAWWICDRHGLTTPARARTAKGSAA